MKKVLFLVVTGLALAMAVPAAAQIRTLGARPLGMGSAFTPNASGNGAIYHNPAGVGTSLMYSVEAGYEVSDDANIFAASVVDSKINPRLAAGAGYSFTSGQGAAKKVSGHDGRLILASQVVPELMVVGVGGRYLDFSGPEDTGFKGFTLDVGAVFKVTDGLFLGAAGRNLIDPCADSEDEVCPTGLAPRTISGGVAFGTSLGFQLVADVEADLSKKEETALRYAGGVELLLAQLLALRGGYQYHALTKSNVVATGAGLKTQVAGFDIGYQYHFDEGQYVLSLALQLFL
jgi:opacity protein-like surface antigen